MYLGTNAIVISRGSFDVSDYISACPDMVNITCESSSGGMFVATLNRNTVNIKKLDLPSNELTNVSCTATNTEGSVDFMTQVLNSEFRQYAY